MEGYPHNKELWPHQELDSCQCTFPWLDVPCLAEIWQHTWDYSTLIRLPLLAGFSFFHQSHPLGCGGEKAVLSRSMPKASTVTPKLPAACPFIIDFCTPEHFIPLCNFSKRLNPGYSMPLHLLSVV